MVLFLTLCKYLLHEIAVQAIWWNVLLKQKRTFRVIKIILLSFGKKAFVWVEVVNGLDMMAL